MTILDELSLESAEMILFVANTAPYLAKHLVADASVQEIAAALDVGQLSSAYVRAISRVPGNFREYVLPYVCIAAIRKKGCIDKLKELQRAEALSEYKWLDDVFDYFILNYMPTTYIETHVPLQRKATLATERLPTQRFRLVV